MPNTTPKKPARAGFVYLIKSDNLYKIGRTQNIKRRMTCLRSDNPRELVLIDSEHVKDAAGVEWALHQCFARNRVSGEWFDLSDPSVWRGILAQIVEHSNAVASAYLPVPRARPEQGYKLTALDVIEIRRRAAEGATIRELVVAFQVVYQTIHDVIERNTWRKI